METLTNRTLRILHPNGTTVGTGFLVAKDLVVTCAHVIIDAETLEGERLQVQFSGQAEKISALVEPKYWRAIDQGDVAFLRIESSPNEITPLPLGLAEHSRPGNVFRSFGYATAADVNGIHANGTLDGYLPQHHLLQFQSPQANHGISGGPVFDEKRQVVVGMITKGHTEPGRNEQTTFATPTELLFEICPEICPAETCPYFGLEAFSEADARFFYGRRRVVLRLLESLKRNPRFLAVLGPSGSGKSSVVQAGLLPELRNGAIFGSEKWQFFQMRPGAAPFSRLEASGLQEAGSGLVAALENWLRTRPETSPVLIVDQFEELFTASPADQREKFLGQLAELLASELPVTVILTLRNDFYSTFTSQSAALTRWLERGQVNVEAALSREALREMITAPAELVGLGFEPGLVEALLEDLTGGKSEGASTQLPLLEFALTQLWGQRVDGRLTHAAYQKLGGVTGGLAAWADRAYRAIPTGQRGLVRQILTDLVHLGDEKQNLPDTRRRMTLAELTPAGAVLAEVQSVVKSLADARLLVTQDEAVEITHEILLQSWPKLREWLELDREALRIRQAVGEAAKAWALNPKNLDLLVHRGGRLEDALKLQNRLTTPERTYLLVCKTTEQRRRRNLITGIALAVLLVMFILAGWAWTSQRNALDLGYQVATAEAAQATAVGEAQARATAQAKAEIEKQNALQQAKIARAGELSAQSIALRNKDFQLSLLLGLEAYTTFETLQSKNALLDNVETQPQLLQYIFGHTAPVTSVAFSPNGEILASGGDDNRVILWDVVANRPVTGSPLAKHTNWVSSIAFSPDGKILASGSYDRTIIFWDMSTHQPLGQPLKAHTAPIFSLAFSPDGKILASGGADGLIMLWDGVTHAPLGQPLSGSGQWIDSVKFSPDGKKLASSGCQKNGPVHCSQGEVILWDVETHQRLSPPLAIRTSENYSLAFSPDGKTLAFSDANNAVILWDLETRQVRGQMQPEQAYPIFSLAFSPDGNFLASASCGGNYNFFNCNLGKIILWDVATQQSIDQPLFGHASEIFSIAFSPDGKMLASGGRDKTVLLWSVAKFQPLAQPYLERNFSNFNLTMKFSPDGKTLASRSDDGLIAVWNLVTRQPIGTPLVGRFSDSQSIAFSPDGKTLASEDCQTWNKSSLCLQGEVILWDVGTGKPIGQPLSAQDLSIASLAFSPDGKTLATGGCGKNCMRGEIVLWNLDTHQPIGQPLVEPTASIWSLAFSPDGKTLASGAGSGNTIILWNLETQPPIGLPLSAVAVAGDTNLNVEFSYEGGVGEMAFSPDGKILASSLDTTLGDSLIVFWDVATRQPIGQPLTGHTARIQSLDFSSDGKTLASGGDDSAIILWDVSTRRPIGQPLHGHDYFTVWGVAFDQDGKRLVSASNFSIVLWDMVPRSWAEKTCQRIGRNFTQAEWTQYFPSEPYRATCPQWPLEPEPTAIATP